MSTTMSLTTDQKLSAIQAVTLAIENLRRSEGAELRHRPADQDVAIASLRRLRQLAKQYGGKTTSVEAIDAVINTPIAEMFPEFMGHSRAASVGLPSVNTKEAYEKALRLARAYCAKAGNKFGGNLHCVLEDGNVEVNIVRADLKRCVEVGDNDGVEVANSLLALHIRQRVRLVNER